MRQVAPRSLLAAGVVALAFLTVAGQLVRLAVKGQTQVTVAMNEPIATSFARPDIVDRNGRLLATDVEAPSLFADPGLILDSDEIVEKLAPILPDLDTQELRKILADKTRRFAWIRRGLAPKVAQRIHDLGLPGLYFKRELRRAYPAGSLAGHVLGHVNVDNKGMAGIERYIDDVVGVDAVHGISLADRAPVRLSLDLGVQHALQAELKSAGRRYRTDGAAGVVLDVATGEVLASTSLPEADPMRPAMGLDPTRLDRISSGTFELGSVFKAVTVAMALHGGRTTPDTMLDVRQPLTAGRFTITDLHPAGRPLSVADVFVRSSNVGAGLLALDAGAERIKGFLDLIGLGQPVKTELGGVAAPQLPTQWERAETITVAYGHGIAIAPLQFAVAASVLVNGGQRIAPTFIKRHPDAEATRVRVLPAEISAQMRDLMRRAVTDASGTGRRADVPGYRVGGKTGTAEIPSRGGYRTKAVISSFLAAFPMDQPRYLLLVMLFEPKATGETKGEVTAGLNAAPVAGRVIARIAPVLGVVPSGVTQTQ